MTALPPAEDKARFVRQMFDRIAPRYDLVNRIMTFGLDVRWRRQAVAGLRLARGSVVLDLACGTGDFCRDLSRAGMNPIGFDFAGEMLRAARTTAPLVQADILRLPVADGSADGITCGFALRNVDDVGVLFDEMARVLRPGGRMVILEVAQPAAAPARAVHGFYFNKVIPAIGGALSDKAAYRYLPESASYLPPGREMMAMLLRAGFTKPARAVVGAGAAQMIGATRA